MAIVVAVVVVSRDGGRGRAHLANRSSAWSAIPLGWDPERVACVGGGGGEGVQLDEWWGWNRHLGERKVLTFKQHRDWI